MKHGSQASSLPDDQATTLPATVAEIGKIHFEGNIIPHQWYQQIPTGFGQAKPARHHDLGRDHLLVSALPNSR